MVIVISEWEPTEKFPLGYSRAQVIANFINSLLLIYASGTIVIEAVERLFNPPVMRTEMLVHISVVGLLINIYGIMAFHTHGDQYCTLDEIESGSSSNSDNTGKSFKTSLEEHKNNRKPSHSHSHSHHSHDNQSKKHIHGHGHCQSHNHHSHDLFQSMYLHILADTMGSVFVILSSVIVKYTGYFIIDPICSIILSILIFTTALPLSKSCIMVLMNCTPQFMLDRLPDLYSQMLNLHGVKSYSKAHFYQYSNTTNLGYLTVQVEKSLSEIEHIRLEEYVRRLFERQLSLDSFVLHFEKS
jgi:zinc transporter 5/7